jgi:uncharacterized membrane protein YhdT
MRDILYLCSWKIIPYLSIYMRYIVPLWLENHPVNAAILGMNFMHILVRIIPLISSVWDEFHHVTE